MDPPSQVGNPIDGPAIDQAPIDPPMIIGTTMTAAAAAEIFSRMSKITPTAVAAMAPQLASPCWMIGLNRRFTLLAADAKDDPLAAAAARSDDRPLLSSVADNTGFGPPRRFATLESTSLMFSGCRLLAADPGRSLEISSLLIDVRR